MIPLLDASAVTEVRLPLWSDPAIIKANSKKARKRYINDGDATALTVPAEATIAVIRALSAQELESAEASAGRKPHFGAVVNARKQEVRKDAGDLDKPEAARKLAEFLDALSDSEASALAAFERWESARYRTIAESGCVRIEHPSQHFSLPEFLAVVNGPLGDSIAHELGFRVQALSGLGDRPKGLPDSASGSERPSGPVAERGDVTNVPSDCGASEATAAALSPTG